MDPTSEAWHQGHQAHVSRKGSRTWCSSPPTVAYTQLCPPSREAPPLTLAGLLGPAHGREEGYKSCVTGLPRGDGVAVCWSGLSSMLFPLLITAPQFPLGTRSCPTDSTPNSGGGHRIQAWVLAAHRSPATVSAPRAEEVRLGCWWPALWGRTGARPGKHRTGLSGTYWV